MNGAKDMRFIPGAPRKEFVDKDAAGEAVEAGEAGEAGAKTRLKVEDVQKLEV